MLSKLASSLFRMIPENGFKNTLRAMIHRARYSEYKTYYRNKVWELHYPEGFVIKYKDVPSPAAVNYLFFKQFTNRNFDIIVDAGGFMGTYGFLMANKYPKAKVYIFEADPVNFQRIKINLALNKLTNVIIEPIGLWDKKDKLKMSVGSDLASSVINEKTDNNTVEIDVISMDEYFAAEKDRTVYIKMNIEGAEIAALNGGRDFIASNKTDLNICSDHLVDGQLSYVTVEKIFASMGMPYQTLRDGIHINTHASNIK